MPATNKTTYVNTEPIKNFVLPSFIKGEKYYLYAHTRHDNGDVFYLGIGTMDRDKYYHRALCHVKRNIIWKRIVAKTGYTILIIDESKNLQDVIKREIQYIALMGKKKDKKGPLSNITDGGEGHKGHKIVWTKEMREAASERLKHRVVKESTREKLRQLIKERSFFGKCNNTKKILQIDIITGEKIREWESSQEAARAFNIKGQSINKAVRKGTNSVGFKWEYVNGN